MIVETMGVQINDKSKRRCFSPPPFVPNFKFNSQDIAALGKLAETNNWLINKILSEKEKIIHQAQQNNLKLPKLVKENGINSNHKVVLNNIQEADI